MERQGETKLIHDDHTHLRAHTRPPAPHALAPLLDEAARRGFAVGVREHPPLPAVFRVGPDQDYDYAMRPDELDGFLRQFAEADYPLGLEVDYFAGWEAETAAILDDILARAAALGVRISGIHGSVHLLPGRVPDVPWAKPADTGHVMWDLDEDVYKAHIADKGPERVLRDYFAAVRALIDFGNFDCLSHLELIRKFDRRGPGGESVYFAEHEKLYSTLARGALENISETGRAVEINTAGVFYPIGRPYISQELLNYAVELGIPVSFGSDAHKPERVGGGFDEALRMLEAAGRDWFVTFDNRTLVKYTPKR